MNSVKLLRAALRRSWKAGRTKTHLKRLTLYELLRFNRDFAALAHAHQEPPLAANNGGPWTTWLMLGGRGAGKTRAGAEFVRALVYGTSPYAEAPHGSIALVGETERDAREVMIEGPAGILRHSPRSERPQWIATRRRLEWPNGAVAHAFSAEDPEQLRGPQFDAAWCDELAKWHHAEETFSMLQFGLRHGARPRQLITTTPRPIPLIRRLVADPRTALTRAPTQANAAHLSPNFLAEILDRYQGTRLGRQEIDAEIVEERADALWTRAMIEACRVDADKSTQCAHSKGHAPEQLARIVVAVDPPVSSGEGAGACGLIAAGIDDNGTIHVLADETAAGLSPAQWARRAVALWRRLQADCLVVERRCVPRARRRDV
jgi:phage terminase large subunit-like protein